MKEVQNRFGLTFFVCFGNIFSDKCLKKITVRYLILTDISSQLDMWVWWVKTQVRCEKIHLQSKFAADAEAQCWLWGIQGAFDRVQSWKRLKEHFNFPLFLVDALITCFVFRDQLTGQYCYLGAAVLGAGPKGLGIHNKPREKKTFF